MSSELHDELPTIDPTAGDRLLVALAELVEIAATIQPARAIGLFDETSSAVFFRDWPTVRSWGDSLFQRLEQDLGRAALPDSDPKSPETGTVD